MKIIGMAEVTIDFWARRGLEVAAALETKGLTLKNLSYFSCENTLFSALVRHIGLEKERT